MKKIYNTPTTKVVLLATQRMIAESFRLNSTEQKSFGNSLSREARDTDWEDEE